MAARCVALQDGNLHPGAAKGHDLFPLEWHSHKRGDCRLRRLHNELVAHRPVGHPPPRLSPPMESQETCRSCSSPIDAEQFFFFFQNESVSKKLLRGLPPLPPLPILSKCVHRVRISPALHHLLTHTQSNKEIFKVRRNRSAFNRGRYLKILRPPPPPPTLSGTWNNSVTGCRGGGGRSSWPLTALVSAEKNECKHPNADPFVLLGHSRHN